MDAKIVEELVKSQREYFISGKTLSYEARKSNLIKLKESIVSNKELILKAFIDDFNKSNFDVYTTEYSLVLQEIDYMLKHLHRLMKPKKVRTSLMNFKSKGLLIKEPYGNVLIMAPWNYPFQLSLLPLVGAIATGNTIVLKPSRYASNVSLVLQRILSVFPNQYIATVLGGREENQALLDQKFDFIFFTGGDDVGRVVLEKASKNLTPCSLELGGKSPTIVDKDADIDLAARRITWGKYLNAGQTCVAPDYILVHASVKEAFKKKVLEYIQKFYYIDGVITPDFPHIINDKHVTRLQGLIDEQKAVTPIRINGRLIEPVVLDNVSFDDPVMKEEIFGPVMPIIAFDCLDDAIERLKRIDHPLAFYIFTKDIKRARNIMNQVAFGGGCINEVVMHVAEGRLPFGGVGLSGMGSYHEEKSFETFSHQKSVLIKNKCEISVKYPPYNEKKLSFIKKFLKIK